MAVNRHDIYTVILISQNTTDIYDVITIDNLRQSYYN
jgi:hypothetical protein